MAGLPPEIRFRHVNKERVAESGERRAEFLRLLRTDPTRNIKDILIEVGISQTTYQKWRNKHPDFKQDVATLRVRGGRGQNGDAEVALEPLTGSFSEKRKILFGFDTPWFQQHTIDAYEKGKPGSITLSLQPPEHGKTSLTEDDLTLTVAENPMALITAISEGQNMARKMSGRIMRRLSPDGPFPKFVQRYGPFTQSGGIDMSQPWSVDAWTVLGGLDADNRDFTFATGGWKSAIAGTRATRLHIDDMQSLRSLDLTEKMWNVFRQDMLSRPGQRGKTTMNGTRVGEFDFYNRLIDEFYGEDFFHLIEYPAIVIDHLTGEPAPLWAYDPVHNIGYTMEMLDELRKKVGEEAWWRNYMQKPKTSAFIVFTDETTKRCQNRMRRFDHKREDLNVDHNTAWLSVDPSIGNFNVVMAAHPGDQLMLLDIQETTTCRTNKQIADQVELVINRLRDRGWNATQLTIEAMAFQKGLMEDEAFKRLEREYGLRLLSHLTNNNKYDEDIGIPSMASSAAAGLIDLPYGCSDDEYRTDQLTAQMQAWKPTLDPATGKRRFKRGNQLRQDQLMALWFLWISWNELRTNPVAEHEPEQFQVAGLPFAMTGAGLLVPTRG